MALPSTTKGQIGQFIHFFIPLIVRFGLEIFFGTLDLINLSLMDFGLLYATNGGAGKVSFRLGLLVTIVRQCFLRILEIEGNRGSKVMTKIGL